MSSGCYRMWNHYTKCLKKKNKKKKENTGILRKTPHMFFLSLFPYRGRQITALVFEKEIGIKCGAINTKI